MNFVDKIKELGEEIKKTVEDSDIKDKAKCATMIITDAVEKGKKGLETKLEENRQKIEDERNFVLDIQEKTVEEIKEVYNNNLEAGRYFENTEELLNFTNEYYEKLFMVVENWSLSNFSLGNYIPKRYINTINSVWNKDKKEVCDVDIEIPLFCYYGGSKDYFLLTNEAVYIKGTHPNGDKAYSIKVECEYIQNISIVEKDELAVFKINHIDVLKVECENISVIKKYLYLIEQRRYNISDIDVSDEIKRNISSELLEKLSNSMVDDEYFTVLSKKINSNSVESKMVCTNKRIIIISSDAKADLEIINTIKYEDIMYIGIETGNVPVISLLQDIFKDSVLEIIVNGSKIRIDKLNRVEAERILFTVNKSKREIYDDNMFSNNETSQNEEKYEGSVVDENIIGQIRDLSGLRNDGILTEEEFQEKKRDLLSRI